MFIARSLTPLLFCLLLLACEDTPPETASPVSQSERERNDADAGPDDEPAEARMDAGEGAAKAAPRDAGSASKGRKQAPNAKPAPADAGPASADAGPASADAGRPDAAQRPDSSVVEQIARAAAAAANGGTSASETPNDVETVVADVYYTLGVDGLPYPNLRPMLLFKDGTASIDTSLLLEQQDLAQHRAAKPNLWTEWKLIDGKIALLKGGQWTRLEFQTKFPPHDQSFSIEDTFKRVSGAGTTGAGGDATLFVEQNLRLTEDKRIVLGSFSAVSVSSTVFANAPADKRGHYEIDGYRLTVRWDDGRTIETSLVYTLEDQTVIFLGGRGFFRLDP